MAVFPAALVLNVSDAGRAAEFWSRAVGYVRQQDAPAFSFHRTVKGFDFTWMKGPDSPRPVGRSGALRPGDGGGPARCARRDEGGLGLSR